MFRLDPKQAVLDHVNTGAKRAEPSELSPLAIEIAARPVEPTYSPAVVVGVAQGFEAVLLLLAGFWLMALGGGDPLLHAVAIIGVVALAHVGLTLAGMHRIAAFRTVTVQIWKSVAAWTGAFAVLALLVLVFDGGEALSRSWMVAFWATGTVVLAAYRLALGTLVRRWTAQGKLKRRTVIVGGGKDAEILIEAIRLGAADDISLFGLFDDRNDDRSPESVASLPKLGRVSDLIEFARRTRVDLVIVSMPLSAEKRVLDMLKQLWVLPVDIRLSAHMSKLRFTQKAYSYVGDVPVFDMADRPISDWNRVFKWLFDKVVAVVALVLLSPVMVATAIAIKLESKGPMFFKQKRHGFNNQLIEMYKFRSMRTDMSDANAVKLVTKGDPRVTKVGRFIRKTSIDELPQLFNVLRGELSIVGPRPHALQAKADNQLYYEAVEGYFARHRVKPGMTGWAQIHGWRGETDTVDKIMQRVNHDLYYIENWSLWLDIKIVALTPVSLFTQRKNAF
jgi:Undecaprenyl-phosphate glucose phosphotransferase